MQEELKVQETTTAMVESILEHIPSQEEEQTKE